MDELRFEGRAALVTGAGGDPGLGRAHALLLARRGAKVVVNDIGRDPGVAGYDEAASAEAVVEEIRALGGEAVADTHSVADPEGAEAIVRTALDAFGRIDIVVNNAGVCIVAPFDEMSERDVRRHVDVNLLGTLWVCRAAWPHMRDQGYGRIVNTASGVIAGFAWQHVYAATKGGVFSLTRALAAEGEDFGIKANVLNPSAFTRMVISQQQASSPWVSHAREHLPPELVSPMVAVLAHEDCPVTGECFEVGGGEARRIYLGGVAGITQSELTPEILAGRWREVMAGAPDQVRNYNDYDPRQWEIKPYHPDLERPGR